MPKLMSLESILSEGRILLSEGFKRNALEAARVCLDSHSHEQGTPLVVDGSFDEEYSLAWEHATDEDKRTYADLKEAVEIGAYVVAFLALIDLTDHTVIERAAKGRGFDFWLGQGSDVFQRKARLEISGIEASPASVPKRTRQKENQTRISDDLLIPAYVAIIEFKEPTARVTIR